MININTQQELDKLIADNKVALVDFWAPWCGPCKTLGPILEKVAPRLAGKAVVAKINIDESAELARQFAVRSIPTMLIFKDAKAATRLVGLRSEDDIVAEVEKYC